MQGYAGGQIETISGIESEHGYGPTKFGNDVGLLVGAAVTRLEVKMYRFPQASPLHTASVSQRGPRERSLDHRLRFAGRSGGPARLPGTGTRWCGLEARVRHGRGGWHDVAPLRRVGRLAGDCLYWLCRGGTEEALHGPLAHDANRGRRSRPLTVVTVVVAVALG